MNNYNFSNTRFVLRETLEDFFTTLKQKLNYPADTMFRISDLDIVANDIEQAREEVRNSRVIRVLNLRNFQNSLQNNCLIFREVYIALGNENISLATVVSENFENINRCYISKTRQFIPIFNNSNSDQLNILTPEKFFEIFPNISNMYYAYSKCYNLTGSPACGNNVTSMYFAYSDCYNLTGSPVCGPNVTNMTGAYYRCDNLTGSPVCGPNVTNMVITYSNCYNLTGSPVCGNNVIDMLNAYSNCYNLTGSPVCGPNVTNMVGAYYRCNNLTGSPVCGPNVTNMTIAYYNCRNLTGDFCTIGYDKLSVLNGAFAYSGISNICLANEFTVGMQKTRIQYKNIIFGCNHSLNLLTPNINLNFLHNLGMDFNSATEDCNEYFYFNDYLNPGYKWECHATRMRINDQYGAKAYELINYKHIREV